MNFFIDNHGCAKNQVDAEEIATRLLSDGWNISSNAENADLIIVNSCGFIEDAKKESIEAVIGIKQLYPDKKILLSGCLSQRYSNNLAENLPEADGIFGNGNIAEICKVAKDTVNGKKPCVRLADAELCNITRTKYYGYPRCAYLKITEGCNNRCSYCAIPIIRGSLRSRTIEAITLEFSELLKQGFYEICLVGQDLGSYGMDIEQRPLLKELLDSISSLEGNFRLRLLYIHPDNFDTNILQNCINDKRIAPYFDIPFQHGSDKIIKAMNRTGSATKYLELLNTIRSKLPSAVIRSTFMTGFPSESEDDFAALLDFQEKAQIDWLGAFSYSREEDTAAYNMKNRVPKRLAQARKKQIENKQTEITEQALRRFIGTVQTVLIEEKIENEDIAIGRAYINAPDVDGSIVVLGENLKAGDVVETKITALNGIDLEAVTIN